MRRQQGFTLVELMIVLLVVAILAAVAMPSYRSSVIKGNRRAAESAMMDIANREHQYFVANRAYATWAELGYTLPSDVDSNYDPDIDLAAGPPPTFTITFTATGGQTDDGDLTLDSLGTKGPSGKW